MNKVVKSTVVYVLLAIVGIFLLAKALTASPGRERLDTLEYSKLVDAHQIDTAMKSSSTGRSMHRARSLMNRNAPFSAPTSSGGRSA